MSEEKYKGKEISKMSTKEIEKETVILMGRTNKISGQLVKNSVIIRLLLEELIFRSGKPPNLEL